MNGTAKHPASIAVQPGRNIQCQDLRSGRIDCGYCCGKVAVYVSGQPAAQQRIDELVALPEVQLGRWLDVGCATGDFLLAAAAVVSEAEGVEMSAYAAERAKTTGGYLSALDIEPRLTRKEIGDFFLNSDHALRNWMGVLFTAILLTLGAPFWYKLLKDAAGLRDMLKPPPPEKQGNEEKK